MERPFQEGDTVLVAKPEPCCGSEAFLGLVFTIERIATPKDVGKTEYARCGNCGDLTNDVIVWKDAIVQPIGFFPSTLKRLPDLLEEEKLVLQNKQPVFNEE